jgi:solute carrier family 25 (mitochondrial phosphate transporter), member 23/24/25/41
MIIQIFTLLTLLISNSFSQKILNQVRGMKTIGNNEYRGVISSLVQMVKIEGAQGLFKGNGTNVIRIAPYSAIQFLSYEKYKRKFLMMNGGQSEHLTPVQNLVAGGFAGITSLLCTYPLDLVRSRLTIQTTEEKYHGIVPTFRMVWPHSPPHPTAPTTSFHYITTSHTQH